MGLTKITHVIARAFQSSNSWLLKPETQSATDKPLPKIWIKDDLIDNVGAELGVGPVIPSNIIGTNSS